MNAGQLKFIYSTQEAKRFSAAWKVLQEVLHERNQSIKDRKCWPSAVTLGPRHKAALEVVAETIPFKMEGNPVIFGMRVTWQGDDIKPKIS